MPEVRPRIAFFDYADVFEDFYPHYGVDQRAFATRWAATGNHAFLRIIQNQVGDVTWYAFSIAPELREARHESVGCRVRFMRSSPLHRALWRSFYLPKQAWRWRGAYRAYATVASYLAPASWGLMRTLRNERPDCFFVQSYSSGKFDLLLSLAHALGVPLIGYHSGGQPNQYSGKLIRRWTLPRAEHLIVSGSSESEMLRRRFRVPPERLSIILTPIDTEAFRPLERDQACEAAGLDPSRRYLLFVGRLDDGVKRVSALIRSFAGIAPAHPTIDLVIVGDGPDRNDLCELAREIIPGRTHFLGWRSGPQALVPHYSLAECLVLPSWREGFPTVVGEAMACGTPVLASRVGGIPELVIEGETGWLVPPGDDRALATRLASVVAQPELSLAMRPKARSLAERRVSLTVVGDQLRACFSRVMRRTDERKPEPNPMAERMRRV